MAGYKYFTVITDKGRELIANAITSETPLDFTEMAIGDSNGLSYDPVSDMTALKHEVYRAAISSMKINTDDANIMEFEFIVPSTSGGYYVREAGLFASDGSLIAISRLPEQYKADMAEGAGSSMTVRILVAVSSEAQLYINVPESINYATQTYVAEEFKKHKADENPHTGYVLVETYSEKITELEDLLAGKADSNHRHDDLYSNINHTHSNYAASSHSHAFSAITGSMAITDSRLTGNLPVNRVTGAAAAPKVYTTTEGTWVETTLNDGSVLLEGYGYFLGDVELKSKYISLPKTCKEYGGVYGSVVVSNMFGLFSSYAAFISAGYCISSTKFMIISGTEVGLMGVSWIFKGILA